MRYRGGGVGHASTREATNLFLSDRHREEIQDIRAIDDIPEVEVGVGAIDHDDEEGEAAEESTSLSIKQISGIVSAVRPSRYLAQDGKVELSLLLLHRLLLLLDPMLKCQDNPTHQCSKYCHCPESPREAKDGLVVLRAS